MIINNIKSYFLTQNFKFINLYEIFIDILIIIPIIICINDHLCHKFMILNALSKRHSIEEDDGKILNTYNLIMSNMPFSNINILIVGCLKVYFILFSKR